MMKGQATAEGTARYAARFSDIPEINFRPIGRLRVSAVGIGTYLGGHDEASDRLYHEATLQSLLSGCNLIDTAINYRCMRSERSIGSVLQHLFSQNKLKRDEVVVCTKGGFLPFDGSPPPDVGGYFRTQYVDRGICKAEDLAAGCHCLEPNYLRDQIDRSRTNLGLETIDLYYLHNPETQLQRVSHSTFYQKLEKAFEVLEDSVSQGKIGSYGLATWTAFREVDQLSLEACMKTAQQIGRDRHHFRAIQLPFNIGMPEAFSTSCQELKGKKSSALSVANELNLAVLCSAALLQAGIVGRLPQDLRNKFKGPETDAQRGIQFVLSTPGVTAALVGMKQVGHVRENLKVLRLPPLSAGQFRQFFREA